MVSEPCVYVYMYFNLYTVQMEVKHHACGGKRLEDFLCSYSELSVDSFPCTLYH